MTTDDFALKVVGDDFGGIEAGSIFDDLLNFIKEALPFIKELFVLCPAARIQRVANRNRNREDRRQGLLYRRGKARIEAVLQDTFDSRFQKDVGWVTDSIICESCCCSSSELESLLQSAA